MGQAFINSSARQLAAVILHGGREHDRAHADALAVSGSLAPGEPLTSFPPGQLGGWPRARGHATELAGLSGLEGMRRSNDGHARGSHYEE